MIKQPLLNNYFTVRAWIFVDLFNYVRSAVPSGPASSFRRAGTVCDEFSPSCKNPRAIAQSSGIVFIVFLCRTSAELKLYLISGSLPVDSHRPDLEHFPFRDLFRPTGPEYLDISLYTGRRSVRTMENMAARANDTEGPGMKYTIGSALIYRRVHPGEER